MIQPEDKDAQVQQYLWMEEHSKIDPKERVAYPPVAISCGEFELDGKKYPIPIGTYGNFSFIQAPPKTKKTYFLSLLATVYLAGSHTNGKHLKGNRGKRKVIHIDTEQGRFHAHRVFKRVSDMAGTNGNYKTYALRQYSARDRLGFIGWKLSHEKNIGLCIIDGCADLVKDVNSLEECNDAVQHLMEWSEKYNCHILTVIHSNYGTEKPTGHLGSAIEKKAETQIVLDVQPDDTVVVKCRRSRGYPFSPFTFDLVKGQPKVIEDYVNLIDTPF